MTGEQKHPFLEGLSKHRGAPPTIIIIFGASGDLTKRKILPAIYNLAQDNLLPNHFYVIGFGRTHITNEVFQEQAAGDIKSFSRRPLNDVTWERLRRNTLFHSGGYDDPEAYDYLKKTIDGIKREASQEFQLLFSISTPPNVIKPILENLGRSGLAGNAQGTALASKIIIEKPFGHDLGSARELNGILRQQFSEEQVFRIDHYLGKETVQDILVQRFANSIFEPIWNNKYVSYVELTVAESLGVGSRGGYYDNSGALRDMIQNHLMQVLALIAMEPPISTRAEDIRNEKVKLLQTIQAINFEGVNKDVVRGQYTEGLIEGEGVCGYLKEAAVRERSSTETYAALQLFINNWRWHGVPFYVRSGKRMARRVSEVAIHFRQPPASLFKKNNVAADFHNSLVVQLQPDEGMSLLLNSKVPGLETRIQPVKMHFKYATTFGSDTPEAYERLILDAMVGDSTLFIRGDETEASWKLITPVLEYWESIGSKELFTYQAGSWGPEASDELLLRNGHSWRKPGF